MHVFTNFKSFEKASINTFKSLAVLIGPNGSGKSNTIEAIELFSFIAEGNSLFEITDLGRGGRLEVRGGLESCLRNGKTEFTLEFNAEIKFDNKVQPFKYSVSIDIGKQPKISKECLYINQTMIFNSMGRTNTTSDDISVQYNNFAKGKNKPQVFISANRSILSRYEEFAKNNTKLEECKRLIKGIEFYLRSSFIFDPNPKLMRSYERMGHRSLSKDGANLSSVLHYLSVNNVETLNRLLGWIKQLPDEPYEKFDFITTKLNDVIFRIKEGENFIDARLLSDGTLRTLAVLTALETVAIGSRVIIEEFDNGLHPSRVQILIQAMQDCCTRRKLNLIVTTHNPATLNSLNEEQLKGVTICIWDKKLNSSNLISLVDLPRYDTLIERGRLGDIITKRLVEQYLKPNFEEENKEKALSWLESLV